MTLSAERSVTRPATGSAEPAPRGGSYVTLSENRNISAVTEGSYVTGPGNRNARPLTRGSYVTVPAGSAVHGGAIEGSYVTLPAAA